ncbi:hypothetical protein C2845_PM03G34610 [Panicum miliaceum]|uniref:Uncharacterized protein n=1 Tax=Panicum miliaceum TaxID=4540 RepID=A0A3L6T6T5_PANMI|nr:hypothetical protein C2845_PM03G34610 [Panicum miliaceum]
MATLCVRPADCFTGRAFFEAPLRPLQQRKSQATPSRPVPGQSHPARGRANNGRQRRRRSPPAAGAGSPPHERAMENVVILKRGEQIPPVFTEASTAATPAEAPGFAQAEKAETALAGKDRRGVHAKMHESVVAAKQSSADVATKHSSAEADMEEPVAVAAAERHGADATKAEAARRTLPQAKEEAERAPLSAATAQPAPYAGASFLVAAPDPRALPIPVLLLKRRGRGARARIRAPDDERAPASTAAAA